MKLLKLVCSDEGGDRKENSNKSRRTPIHLRTFEKAVMGKGKEKRLKYGCWKDKREEIEKLLPPNIEFIWISCSCMNGGKQYKATFANRLNVTVRVMRKDRGMHTIRL